MNYLKILRKPILAKLMAILILYASCEQHQLTTEPLNQFDYTVYNTFRSSNAFSNIMAKLHDLEISFKNDTDFDKYHSILKIVNEETNAGLNIPDNMFLISDQEPESQLEFAYNNGMISKIDYELGSTFITDIMINDFETALENYESSVLSLDLDSEEFSVKNNVANMMKSLNDEYPSLFDNSQSKGSGWRCALATVAFLSALAGLSSCATVVACGLAMTLFVGASINFVEQCGEDPPAGNN